MKNRLTALLLAGILLVGALAGPVSSAGETTVFQDLANYLMRTGEEDQGDYCLSYPLDAENEELFEILYYGDTKIFELSICDQNTMCITLTLHSVVSDLYAVTASFASENGSASGAAVLAAASYTGEQAPELTSYSGDEWFHQYVISALQRFLPRIVEELGVLLWEDGHRLSELGFTAFRVHTKHLYETAPDPESPPTCTQAGYLRKTCVVCQFSIREDAPALGHDWDAGTVTQQPTCVAAGVCSFRCTRCDAARTEAIPPTGEHSWILSTRQEPTCEADGWQVRTCTVCGTSIREDVPPLGHDWNAGRVIKQPTCAAAGLRSFRCTRCDAARTETIPPTGEHSWTRTERAPTCTRAGSRTETCAVCGETRREQTSPALGHNWDAGKVTTQPTCAAAGLRSFRCTRCSAVRTETIPPTGKHSWVRAGIEDPATGNGHCASRYVCAVCRVERREPLCVCDVFTDAPAPGNWAHAPIDWAYFRGITAGTQATKFSPHQVCTRAQVVTFLWRAVGKPKPAAKANPFRDVKPSDYYDSSVLWAVEQGITKGVTKTGFAPNDTCTRAQVVTFLWRACGAPEPKTKTNPFRDVSASAYFCKAVLWAVENGVTQGTGKTKFSPDAPCTRAQVVAFLYRAKALEQSRTTDGTHPSCP